MRRVDTIIPLYNTLTTKIFETLEKLKKSTYQVGRWKANIRRSVSGGGTSFPV
jgi:hypothetical protein